MPEPVTLTAPRYVPGTRPVGSTETFSAAGVAPVVGLTASQAPPEIVDAAALKPTAAPLEEAEIDCIAGAIPPV